MGLTEEQIRRFNDFNMRKLRRSVHVVVFVLLLMIVIISFWTRMIATGTIYRLYDQQQALVIFLFIGSLTWWLWNGFLASEWEDYPLPSVGLIGNPILVVLGPIGLLAVIIWKLPAFIADWRYTMNS